MTAPRDAIAARRRLTNKLIAAREALRLRPFFAPDAQLIPGGGGLILGVDAIVEAFAAQFREPGFVAYVRTPDSIEIDTEGERAAETGRWTGNGVSGRYMAAWRKVTGQWVITESEQLRHPGLGLPARSRVQVSAPCRRPGTAAPATFQRPVLLSRILRWPCRSCRPRGRRSLPAEPAVQDAIAVPEILR